MKVKWKRAAQLFVMTLWMAGVAGAEDATEVGREGGLAAYFQGGWCDRVITKQYYRICFDDRAKGPKYVGYVLDGRKVSAGNIEKRPRFYPEKQLPRYLRVRPGDYTRNPYRMDRGHLAPDAAFDWAPAPLRSVYTMANIIPQYYRVNRKTWIKAEKYARRVARRLGSLVVLNGVEYGDYRTRLKKGVGQAVPVAFWKAMWNMEKGFRRCFYYRNRPISQRQAQEDRLAAHQVGCGRLLRHVQRNGR